ncbi:MAG TPA: hypothetical protein PLL36_08950 [Candidatus Hydrogenedentes bacterium]|nr:hypothetical protein [Candidatus Hydrogenedentota bacterium]
MVCGQDKRGRGLDGKRVFDPNQAYRYYQERYDAEQRVRELEIENAELRALARLQRALDRIEETGILCFGLWRDTLQDAYGIEKVSSWCCELFDDQDFYGNWTYEAAEKAAEWAEAQKGAGE